MLQRVSLCGTSLLVWDKSSCEGHKNDHMTCFPDGGYFAGEWEEEGLQSHGFPLVNLWFYMLSYIS